MRGVVKWYHSQKHFGFLLTWKENKEVFFHINDCKGFNPKEGIEVEFEAGMDRRGRNKAVNITQTSVSVGVEHGRYSQ